MGYEDATLVDGVLVTSGDVLNCPYRFIQPVKVNATEDYGMGKDRAKIFAKFRKEAKKLGADAVLMVTAGETHMTAFAWNRREYTGRAVRFVDRSCKPEPSGAA
ncbi:hypothetical protein N0B51_09580 [Tsuneonella sp. YG55]|uniref:Uncharacterized protein n=1 Tax=Tsuneonella litorea TaxID=2976475 RepID=A0A9X3AL46_9SPHN|nr:hypothetical protein [Tsuneonella litorea]MCT2559234.1 hypothetical protein [Tsuneonella litorea]